MYGFGISRKSGISVIYWKGFWASIGFGAMALVRGCVFFKKKKILGSPLVLLLLSPCHIQKRFNCTRRRNNRQQNEK